MFAPEDQFEFCACPLFGIETSTNYRDETKQTRTFLGFISEDFDEVGIRGLGFAKQFFLTCIECVEATDHRGALLNQNSTHVIELSKNLLTGEQFPNRRRLRGGSVE